MINCYLIDDDKHALEILFDYIQKIPWISITGANTNPKLALEEIGSKPLPDVVFLDVEMPVLSGLEVASMLPAPIYY